jgi:hypothetical protein
MGIRITKLERMMNDQMTKCRDAVSGSFACHAVAERRRVIRASFGIRNSSFVICRTVLLMVIAQMSCSALAQAQTPNMTGTWKLEITFANEQHHSLRFEAQGDGKGSLQLTDPAAKVWSGAKPSEAKWSRGEGNSVTFSGPVEFLLGNVGRDPGTLTCKGKFESADLISGEVEFSPSVGDRPSKHGTFKAVRSGT